MRITVTAYDTLGMMTISAAHAEDAPDGAVVSFHFQGRTHVPMTPEVFAGGPKDQLAFLAECLLDMAYER